MSDQAKKIHELEQQVAILKGEIEGRQAACSIWIEERERTESRLRLEQAIVDNSPVVLFRRNADEQSTLEYVSDNVRNFGYEAEEFISGRISFKDIVHPDDHERVGLEIQRNTERQYDAYTQEYRILTRSGEERWIADRTVVVRDEKGNRLYHQGILHDITRRKLAEEEVKRNEEKLLRILGTAAEGYVLLGLDMRILEANQAMLSMLGLDRDEVIGASVLDFAAPEFKRYLLGNLDSLLAMEQRRIEGIIMAKDGREVPVLIHGSILRDENGEPEGHVAFISDQTQQKKALQLAEEVQKSLQPSHSPDLPGLDIAGRSLSSAEVGGDYYDFVQSESGLNVAVGDISGHGVDAALLMTSARAFMRMRAASPGAPAQIVREMNRHLSEDLDGTGRFMTLFLIRFDENNGHASWVRAGHDPALVYCPRLDTFTEMGGSGLPLGVDAETEFEENLTDVHPGQIIAIGTDGIWEATSPRGEMFGKQRFRNLIRENAHRTAKEIIDAIFDEVVEFTAGVRPEDDVTLVVVKSSEETA